MLTPVNNIVGDDEEDTRLLNEYAQKARNYITSFRWCLPIKAMYLAYGIGGILALFLIEFEGKIDNTDDRLWVVVGDLPSVYMVVESGDTVRNILEAYCGLMDDWISAVRTNGNFEKVYPVRAARTEEHADMLSNRLKLIRENILPDASDDLIEGELAR